MQLSKHHRHRTRAWATEGKGCCSRIPAHLLGPRVGCLLYPPLALQLLRPRQGRLLLMAEDLAEHLLLPPSDNFQDA